MNRNGWCVTELVPCGGIDVNDLGSGANRCPHIHRQLADLYPQVSGVPTFLKVGFYALQPFDFSARDFRCDDEIETVVESGKHLIRPPFPAVEYLNVGTLLSASDGQLRDVSWH